MNDEQVNRGTCLKLSRYCAVGGILEKVLVPGQEAQLTSLSSHMLEGHTALAAALKCEMRSLNKTVLVLPTPKV